MMTKLSREQRIQESRYEFPYHHIAALDGENFRQARTLSWGYEYLSYLDFVLKKIASLEFTSLLDVGCGDGKFLYEASRRFPQKRLVGLDSSEPAIAYARVFTPNVEYACEDITDTAAPPEDRFDIVTSIETLEHIPPNDVRTFVERVHGYVKDDGLLVMTMPTTNIPVHPKHHQHFDPESLSKLLNPFFSISRYYFLNRISKWERVLYSILTNRMFILNEQHLLNLLYRAYVKFMLPAGRNNAKRMCVVCTRNKMS